MEASSIPQAAWGVVSGASSGIGLHIARELLGRGHRVAGLARDPARLAAARASLGEAASRFEPVAVDVCDAAALHGWCEGAIRSHGPPAWVVACAGMVRPGRFLDLMPEAHRASLEVNLGGALHLLHACVPAMARRGTGRVVLVSSAAALTSLHGFSAYSPSKAALRALGDVLSLELAADGISVTTAFPPDTDTPQLHEEMRARPPVTRAFLGRNRVHAAEAVASRIIRDASLGRRYSTIGIGARFLLALSALGDEPGRRRQLALDARLRQGQRGGAPSQARLPHN